MTSLLPCPRCTQLLPSTAAYCRRCGLAVPMRVAAVAPPTRRGGRRRSPLGLLGIVVLGAVVCGSILKRSPTRSTSPFTWTPPAVTTTPPTQPPTRHDAIAQPVVPRVYVPLELPHRYGPSEQLPPGYGAEHHGDDRRRR